MAMKSLAKTFKMNEREKQQIYRSNIYLYNVYTTDVTHCFNANVFLFNKVSLSSMNIYQEHLFSFYAIGKKSILIFRYSPTAKIHRNHIHYHRSKHKSFTLHVDVPLSIKSSPSSA